MYISIGGNTVLKNEVTPVTLNVSEITTSLTNTYFKNEQNWKRICFVYTPDTKLGNKQITFVNNGSGMFNDASILFSEKARVGSWILTRIAILDFEGNQYELTGTELPSNLNLTVS